MSELIQRVEESILEQKLLRRGQAVLVAVSGGLDSMVLLEVLARLAGAHRWHLAVAHFNHQLRGRSSDADERLVARTAKRLGLRFVVDRGDVRKHAIQNGLSVEMAARELRHSFLARAARRLRVRTVALAHHADDQVELFFLRLLRGSGGEGLGGMKWLNPSAHDERIMLVRPLLDETKQSLRAFAKDEGVQFREDATNAQLDIQRNRIRHELLPQLARKYQPALSRVVLRQMEILRAEADYVTQMARECLTRPRDFAALPVALQRRCLQMQAAEQGIAAGFELIERLRRVPNRPFALDETRSFLRHSDGRLEVRVAARHEFDQNRRVVELQGRGGALVFDNVEITWKTVPVRNGAVPARKKSVNCEYFDADKVGRRIVLRHWQPGDRFQPIGMEAAVKLQDLFMNQKVLRADRHRLILGATANGEMFWVEGMRLGDRFKLDKTTRRRLQWVWKRL